MSDNVKKQKNKSKITVAILEDNMPTLNGLQLELDKPDIHICCATNEPKKFLELAKTCQPRIAIIDLRIWSDFEAGFVTLERLKEISPETKCILYTFLDQLEYFHRGINLGIRAFVSKNIHETPMEKVIRIVASGGTYYGELLGQYLDKIKEMPTTPEGIYASSEPAELHLSKRVLEVLNLFGEGKSEDEIAKILYVTKNTVRAHTKRAREYFEVKSTKEAVRMARLRDLI